MTRLFLIILLFAGCKSIDIKELPHFSETKFLGKWHEIARLNHSFEKNLIYVTADYSPLKDGSIQVVNSGYNLKSKKWHSANARAVLTDKQGQFKIFFIPFISGDYKIAYIDDNYTTAVVSGGTSDYLWFLSRTPAVNTEQLKKMLEIAKNYGYNIDELIFPATIINSSSLSK